MQRPKLKEPSLFTKALLILRERRWYSASSKKSWKQSM